MKEGHSGSGSMFTVAILASNEKQGFNRLRDFQMTLPSLGQPDTFTLYEKKL